MPMEQETMSILIAGFSIIMGIALIVVVLLMFSKNRKPYRAAYGLIIGFFVFFSLTIIQAFKAISFNVNHPMASEEISLRLVIAGVLWGISMVFLLGGLIKFSSVRKNPLGTR
jgi:hypothetical protein